MTGGRISRRALIVLAGTTVSKALATGSEPEDVRAIRERTLEFVESLRRRDRRTALTFFSRNAFESPAMFRGACGSFGGYDFMKTAKDRRKATILALDWYIANLDAKEAYALDAPSVESGIVGLNDPGTDRFLVFRGSDIASRSSVSQLDGSSTLRMLMNKPRVYVTILPFKIGPCFFVWATSRRRLWEILHAETFCE